MDERTVETETVEDDAKLSKFKNDISKDASVVDDQRQQANQDMRFVNVTGGMWEGFLTDDFSDDRIKLEFDIVSNYLQRYLGEWSSNPTGVEFKPNDMKTSDDDAELLNGIYRSDFRSFSGEVATDLAVDEAATCGVGALKLATFFEDDEDPENDNQRIEWRPIPNAYNSVFWDQSAQRIDKKDARWCTVLKSYTKDEFEEIYPDSAPVSAYSPETLSYNDNRTEVPDLIYIATRYEAIKKKEKIFIYGNLETGDIETYSKEDHDLIADELAADEFRTFQRERTIMRRSVMKTVFSGDEILHETTRIAGKFIPIIPFYGFRSYVDGIEWYRGLVRNLKDASRLFNMQVSQLAENAASAGQEVPIFTPEQMENSDIANAWADKNNKPFLLAGAVRDDNGNIVHTGPIGYSKPPQLDGSTTALMSIVPGYIQDVTGGAPQDTLDPNMSGKAIQALLKRENLATRTITRNISDAIKWSGEVYQSIASEIYSSQRIIDTVSKDGREAQTQMHKSILDEETGKLIETNTIHDKKFKSYSDTGPQYDSMREQTVEDLKGMLDTLVKVPNGQQYVPVLIGVLLENISGVGMDPVKEFNRRMMLIDGLVKPETEEEQAMVMQHIQSQNDPQQELLAAVANKENAEARSLDASSLQKVADAKKKEAETIETLTGIDQNQQKINLQTQEQLNKQRAEALKTLQGLPLQ